MLQQIHIENCFAHANSTFNFQTGMTAISGPNFKGKSQILEMVRFALFGASALRTNATDYKGAKVTLTFKVMTRSFRMERTTTNAKLFEDDELICTGTKPVNLKMVDIFGYGLEVFDTANVATQGMIEALGSMKPAERKRLVDSTIGLNLLDDLAKWCGDEASLKRRELETLQGTLRIPAEPDRPAGYKPLAELVIARQVLTGLVVEKQGLEQALAAEPALLEVPECIEPRTLEVLETTSRVWIGTDNTLGKMKATLKQLPPPPLLTLEQIEEEQARNNNFQARKNALEFMSAYPTPSYNEDQLTHFEQQLLAHDQWKAWHELYDKGQHCCPACSHTWPFEHEKLKALGDWHGKSEPSEPPVNSLLKINQHRTYIQIYESKREERAFHTMVLAAHPQPNSASLHSTASLQAMRRAHDAVPLRAPLEAEIASLQATFDAMPSKHDIDKALDTRRKYERSLRAYLQALEVHTEWASKVPGWQARLAELADVDAQLEATVALQIQVQTFDNMHTRYLADLSSYEVLQGKITSLEAEVDQYNRAKLALVELKSRVKGYLVPSLSRVASGIVSQMTAGAVGPIDIDEDFDILVGGKPIDGLSGCGKAAANLAIRIGLGQVLTNRVFSVFMADEIDAAMDADNAGFTAECLRNLTSSISQIILVSHKNAEADHYIRL